MRPAFERILSRVASSPILIATVVVLFSLSAALLEYLIHTTALWATKSVSTQAVMDAVLVGVAAAFAPLLLLLAARERRRRVLDDLRKIAEINHHVRNALQSIVYNQYLPRSDETRNAILDGVSRIDGILRELFPVVGNRSDDAGWKVVSINGTRAYARSGGFEDGGGHTRDAGTSTPS